MRPPTTAMTLVLGHGRAYLHDTRCSPVDLGDGEHTSVDISPEAQPDILYDLRRLPWAFAADASFVRIIDASGLALQQLYRRPEFLRELDRVLEPNGTFQGTFHGRKFEHVKRA